MPKNPTFMGKMIEVDIYESGKHFMKGQPVSDAKVYTPSINKPLAKGEVSGLTEVSRRRFSLYLAGKTAADSSPCFCYRLQFPFYVCMRLYSFLTDWNLN